MKAVKTVEQTAEMSVDVTVELKAVKMVAERAALMVD